MIYELERVSIRLVKDQPVLSDKKITTPEAAVEVLQEVLQEADREVICVINLKSDGTPINFNIVSVGTIQMSLFHPRELLKSAILSNAAGMIMIHNHLGSNVFPSMDDKAITVRMTEVSQLIGIPVYDHIIVAADTKKIYSFYNQGELKEPQELKYSELNMKDAINKILDENRINDEAEAER